ncbi:hypothetical protein K8640_23745 [Myxococcus sp. XM-1-1-1]|uniref:phospholipase D-like domain-containing protein n=1 Tax=Myxococcus sp. XM-1-1-1 TaxID=2874602 RepID=UPI001CBF70C4|nr:phospholipase D-like domain-containing protein [Myxococcus sp. XM-1-1-1]MBZ4411231.1 hypothetical protein [Myxococcus sp. XM-1-1-1]
MSERLDLLRELNAHTYDHALLLTYNFQPDFFEEYCLEQLAALEANNNVTVIMDAREFQAILAGERGRWPRKANLRYLLHPVSPARRFHPKLALFTSARTGLLVIGSGNLTRAGLSRNAEMTHVFSFSKEKHEDDLPLFHDALSLLRAIADRWPDDELSSRINDLRDNASWLQAGANRTSPSPSRLLHNLTEPLFAQISVGIAGPVERVLVLSPFFDPAPELLDVLDGALHPKEVLIYTQPGAPMLTPAWLDHPLMKRGTGKLLFSEWSDDNRRQELHAKAVAIQLPDGSWRLFAGSANFTRAAMLCTPAEGNVETGILTDGIRLSSQAMRAFFDPSQRAREQPLKPVQAPSPIKKLQAPLSLGLAQLDHGTLTCVLEGASGGPVDALLQFPDGATVVVPLDGVGTKRSASLPAETVARCDRQSVVVSLQVRGSTSEASNRVLLHNHKDIVTGGASRRERRMREAVRSAEKFAAVLAELLVQPDLSALMEFLTYCDIPLAGAPRLLLRSREVMSAEEVDQHLRTLGERNLRAYQSLHEATLGFSERHTRRLHRHAATPSLDLIPSCMHLIRSVASVLNAQIQRLITGLEETRALTIDDWYTHRQNLDAYLHAWSALLTVASTEWLPRLAQAFNANEVRKELAPDLDALGKLRDELLRVRHRVERCAAGTLAVITPRGNLVKPSFNPQNVVSPTAWPRFERELTSMYTRFRQVA